jgi:hypothetical protein
MPTKKPGVPKQPKPAKRVRVTIGDGKADFLGKTNIQKALRTTAPQAPKFNAAIKAALDTWSKDTDQAVTIWDNIINAEAGLEQMYSSLGAVLLQVGLDRSGFLTAVQNVCISPADAKSFGLNDTAPATHVEPLPPTAIRQINTAVPGENRIRWASDPHAAAYQAETSVDPPTPTSWVAAYTGKSPFFLLTGAPGQKQWVRIAAVGSAPSAWSTAFPVTLR